LGLSLYGSIYIIPVYLSQIQGYDAAQIGQVIMWMGLPQLLVFPLVPLLMKRIDARFLLGFGLIVFAASNFMNVDMTHDTAEPQLRWSMLVRAAGQPFVITIITQMATARLRKEDMANASSLFNVMRNLGGSMGIALLQTFTTWQEHFHFDIISQHLSRNNLITQERVQTMAHGLASGQIHAADPTTLALIELQNMVRREAYVMAYSDCFYIMGAVLLFSVIAIFFMEKLERTKTAAAH
jgi:DHA2 family multidrug resistance protein